MEKLANGDIVTSIKQLDPSFLPNSEVTIKVSWSSVNYKDGLAIIPNSRVVKSYPMIPGIDLAGVVEESNSSKFAVGDRVLVTGYELGVSHFGGFSEYAKVPEEWIVPLPKGMEPREAMTIGTAGFTAALSLYCLERNGLKPDQGPVIVTGASGGVGSIAIALLAKVGYHVVASTGKETSHSYLQELGAGDIIPRFPAPSGKVLESEKWAAAIDPVGGETLSQLLRTIKYNGSVALSGLTGGTKVESTVYPFIIRGISLLGIDSAYCPMNLRREIWRRLANEWTLSETALDAIGQEIAIDELSDALSQILKGQIRGRRVVRLSTIN